jgi:hypothetical protein
MLVLIEPKMNAIRLPSRVGDEEVNEDKSN